MLQETIFFFIERHFHQQLFGMLPTLLSKNKENNYLCAAFVDLKQFFDYKNYNTALGGTNIYCCSITNKLKDKEL